MVDGAVAAPDSESELSPFSVLTCVVEQIHQAAHYRSVSDAIGHRIGTEPETDTPTSRLTTLTRALCT